MEAPAGEEALLRRVGGGEGENIVIVMQPRIQAREDRGLFSSLIWPHHANQKGWVGGLVALGGNKDIREKFVFGRSYQKSMSNV